MQSLREKWSPESWRKKNAVQQVVYTDKEHLTAVLSQLQQHPPLVTSWEIEALRKKLAEAATGRRFLLQGGDCAESFDDCKVEFIKNRLKILLQMSVILIYGMRMPIIRVGRFAGQYAKPRSASHETRNGISLPSYRGDNINAPEFTPEAREPDPQRLLHAYYCSAIQLNLVRALGDAGFADLHNADKWNLNFAGQAPYIQTYQGIIGKIYRALDFAKTVSDHPIGGLGRVTFYSSHEALHLPYEEAFTREVIHANAVYNLSTHMPWIGKRTLFEDSAHVEYMRGIRNPIGIKIGHDMAPSDLKGLIRHLNPLNDPGRLTIITRMGATKVEDVLPQLIDTVKRSGLNVLWCCDPMHGNTETASSGIKTRKFGNILAELEAVIDMHARMKTVLGGVHFELTGEDVTECVGGASGIREEDLNRRYHSTVDPRLNVSQSLEMALKIAQRYQNMETSK
ncbi:MAG: 3-deoxy-7-phosphoheptulonate synthase class II [Bacteroidetes bacterium]|nr:3-deoxy-7-phosphoheptulonate synthase class II [Bacteroidota bacterium]